MPPVGFFDHAQQCLEQWGMWARRPACWADLRSRGMYALIAPMMRQAPAIDASRDWLCDPASARIHAAVLGLGDLTAGVLYARYVRLLTWEQQADLFRAHGLSRPRFYALLREGTVQAYIGARSIPEVAVRNRA